MTEILITALYLYQCQSESDTHEIHPSPCKAMSQLHASLKVWMHVCVEEERRVGTEQLTLMVCLLICVCFNFRTRLIIMQLELPAAIWSSIEVK